MTETETNLMTVKDANAIAAEYETRIEEIEASTIAMIREIRAEAQRISDEANRVYEATGDRETAREIYWAAQRLTGTRGLTDRLQTIGQGLNI